MKNFVEEFNKELGSKVPSNAKLIWEMPSLEYFKVDSSFLTGPNTDFGVLIDFEATGKDLKKDLPVEIGLIKFAYDRHTLEIVGVTEIYGELEDPGIPISEEATAVNGITNDMIKGKSFDDKKIEATFQNCSLVIAHNAFFDRQIGEKRFPFLKEVDWGCSFKDLDWSNEFLSSSAKLEYLAFKAGFYYSAHRAVADCVATLAMLDYIKNDQGNSAFSSLVKNVKRTKYKVWASGAPFAVKNVLTDAGYKWSNGEQEGSDKAWFKIVFEEDLDKELKWMKSEIFYNKSVAIRVDRITAKNAFSDRVDEKMRVPL